MYNGSGDYVIAFSTASSVRIRGARQDTVPRLSTNAMSPLFQAALEAVEESIYNSLLKATTVLGRDRRRIEAIDVERVVEVLRKYGRGK
jgi:D-aminopeptidase